MNICRERCLAIGIVVGLLLLLFGWQQGELKIIAKGMTYGNFDVPNRSSFVQLRMVPGTVRDHAQKKIYRFDSGVTTHWAPIIVLSSIFVFFFALLFAGHERRFEWKRRMSQWLVFVALRMGVLRVANISPVKRSTLGCVPVLNCQSCEMATGACPVGTLQNFLLRLDFPFFLVGSMFTFGLLLGRWACGWLCPFGMISDLVDRVSGHRYRPPHYFRAGKYVMLSLLLLVGLAFGLTGATTSPFCFSFCPAGKILGLTPYFLTSAAEETPVLVTSPLANTVGFLCSWWHLIVMLTFAALMLFISGRVFCTYLCPLGGFLGLFQRVAAIRIGHEASSCTNCDRCLAVCPMAIDLASDDFLTHSDCVACGRCVRACVAGARHWDFACCGKERVCEVSQSTERVTPTAEGKTAGCYIPFKGKVVRFLLPMLTKTPQAMARYAKNHTAFFRKFYEGYDPDDFDALPLLHKTMVRQCSPYDLLTDVFKDKVTIYGETTGSTGSPTPSFLTDREFNGAALLSNITPYAGRMAAQFNQNRTCINGLAFGFTIAGQSFGDMLAKNGGLVANLGSRSTLATPPRIASAISRLEPAIITGTPIDFLCWMRILKEDHSEKYEQVLDKLDVLLSSAELCSSSRSKAIEEHFGINHVDNYATVEGFFTMACPCGNKHILPIYLTELFDQNLNKIGRYGRGRLVFTNLVKRSSPLVRYLLDDLVTISPSRCPWGFKTDIIPHGRYELSVRIDDELLNVGDFEEEIFKEGLFGDYRVELYDGGKAEILLEDYAASEGAAERVAGRMRTRFGLDATVLLKPFGHLTQYRDVRVVKPILKLCDKRSTSEQEIPEVI